MSERKPVREAYDVEIDLGGDPDGDGCFAYALIKLAYRINVSKGLLEPMTAVPLENDIRDDNLTPRLPAHTDYWPFKKSTDVAVIGSAYAPAGRPVEHMQVSLEIAGRSKQLLVFGDRFVEWSRNGHPKLGDAQPFTTMPMGIERAYGGCDFRVPFDKKDPRSMGVTLECDYPGLYPRNPWGTGYLVMPEPIKGMRLPNLEDPDDLLTDDRIITSDPAEWYLQPLPSYLDWMPVNCFPRNLFLAIECEPWFPSPDDERLKEVQRGFLPKGFRQYLKDQHFGTPAHMRFRQESSNGMMFSRDLFGTDVRVIGMHPKQLNLGFQLPKAAPSVEMKIEDKREHLQANLASIAIYPDQEYVTMTYTVSMSSPRPFIPGIHKYIPIAVSVNGDRAVLYQPPDTIKDRLDAAKAAQDES
ncbi:MAG: DUF2169 domain-containing protein [Lysobacterales bacterium]